MKKIKNSHQHHQALVIALALFITLQFSGCTSQSNSKNASSDSANQEEWVQLFNGKDLINWTPKFEGQDLGLNYKNTFQVEDSLLKVRYDNYEGFKEDFKFGHLFFNEKFSHYRIRAKYRFVGEQLKDGPAWAFRNNGLMLHCQSPESLQMDQEFPSSLELQLLGGNGKDQRSNGNLCTPGTLIHLADTLCTSHCINSTSKTYHGDQWVEIEALVLGDSLVQHILDQEVVFEYTQLFRESPEDPSKPGEPAQDGYISIQSETHPIDFARIEVLNLCGCMDKKAKNYKSYYIKANNRSCIY